MPPSRQSQAQQAQQPPPQQPNFEDVAAALAAGTAASTAATASPAAAGAVTATAGALTAAQIAQTSRAVVQKMMDWTKNRWNYMLDPSGPLSQTVKAEYPNQRVRDVMALLDEREREYEREFRRKMRKRLQEDIPAALSLPTMKERKDALKRIFEREKRYTAMREEAILARAMGALEAALLQDLSPEGAYWKLSPTVREHTLDCLAMGEKFWPWSVLRKIQPPLHYGCPCFLLGLDEAIDEGLMTRDQVPNEADARERYAKLADQIDDLRDLNEQAVEELHEIAALNMIEEVRVRRPLRWAKGFVKGGQFRPTRGGSSSRTRALPLPESPAKQRGAGRGRWTWVGGRYTKIPQADAWTKQVDGRTYHSPPGGTNLYRDGKLLNTPDQPALPAEKKRSPGVNNNIPPELAAKIEAARASLRGAATGRGEPPVSEGDNASAVLSLEDAGYQLIGSERQGRKSRLRYKKSAGTLTVGVEDAAVTEVVWEPAATNRKREALTQPPADWDEFSGDVLAHADELGEKYGAEVRAPNISVDPALADHSGMHEWSGDMSVGRDVPPDIANAARSRAAGKELTDYEKRGVYASYWVTSHEVAHAINPIPPLMFKGANANLEEALAEEISHKLALDRLARHGQYDVIDWRWRNPDALPVRGVYPNERFALQTILDEAGVPIVDRPRIIENLSFRIDPAARLPYLATLHAANTGGDRNKSRERVETLLRNPPRAPRDFRSIINPSATRMLGSGQYGLWEDGKLSDNGTVLTLPNGSRRVIEKMDPNWMPGLPVPLEDGKIVGITTYPPGVEITPGEFFANGKAKTFGDFRPIDSTDRAKLMLRGWVGRPEPGAWVVDPDALDRATATIDSDAVASVGDGVPVVRFNDGTYGVGQPHGSSDDRNLTILPNSRDAAELALMRSDLATAADVSTLPTSPVKTFIDDKYAEQIDLFSKRVGMKSPGVATAEQHVENVRRFRRETKTWRKEDFLRGRYGTNPLHSFGHVNQDEAKKIGALIDESTLSVRMPGPALSSFLSQGTIRNSIDLGKRPKWRIANKYSNDDYLQTRQRHEAEVFGPDAHPVYGYFRTDKGGPQEDATRLYGNVIVELNDEVKDRTTYTVGDSLNNREEVIPVPVGEANSLAILPLGPSVRDIKSLDTIDDLFVPLPAGGRKPKGPEDRVLVDGEWVSARNTFDFIRPEYTEAQIFGDRPSLDEVKRVIFQTPEDRDVWENGAWVEKPANWFGPTDAQVRALDKAGIPWEFRASTGKVRRRGRALPEPPMSPGTAAEYDREELAKALDMPNLWIRDVEIPRAGDYGRRKVEIGTNLGGHLLGYLAYHFEPGVHEQDEYWDNDLYEMRPLADAPDPDALPPEDVFRAGEPTGEMVKAVDMLEVRPLVRRMGVATALRNGLRDIEGGYDIVSSTVTPEGAAFRTAYSGTNVRATIPPLPETDDWDGDLVPLTDLLAAQGVKPKGMRSPGVGADRNTGIYPNYNGVKLTMGGGAGGSNGARWATDPEGNRWLVKTYGGDEDRIATELVANRVYNIMGARVADAGIITINGREALTYKALDGEVQYDPFSDGPNAALGQHYMTDAFLANWDFVGLEDDNILWDADGDPIRVDQGGTLEYRAMGEPKPYEPVPNDVWSMLLKGQAKRATLVTEDQMREQAREIAYRLTPDVIDRLLDDAPFEDDEMRERLRVNMKARVEWMREYGGEQAEVFSVPEGAPVAALFRDSQSGIEVTDAETDSLAFYALGGYEPAQRALRSGEPLEAAPEKAQNAIVALDSLMVSVPKDIYVYVPFDGDADVVGRTVQERGYLHATVEKPDGPAIRLLVPQGARAVNLRELDASLPDEAPEVVLARGSRMKLTGEDGDVIEGTLIPAVPRSPGTQYTQPDWVPPVLYHFTERKNAESIARDGLRPGITDNVFLTDDWGFLADPDYVRFTIDTGYLDPVRWNADLTDDQRESDDAKSYLKDFGVISYGGTIPPEALVGETAANERAPTSSELARRYALTKKRLRLPSAPKSPGTPEFLATLTFNLEDGRRNSYWGYAPEVMTPLGPIRPGDTVTYEVGDPELTKDHVRKGVVTEVVPNFLGDNVERESGSRDGTPLAIYRISRGDETFTYMVENPDADEKVLGGSFTTKDGGLGYVFQVTDIKPGTKAARKKLPTKTIAARLPGSDDPVGSLSYTEYDDHVEVEFLHVAPAYRRRGVATLLNKRLDELFPDTPIDHGERTTEGQEWADSVLPGDGEPGGAAMWTLGGREFMVPWEPDMPVTEKVRLGQLADDLPDAPGEWWKEEFPEPPRSPGTATRLEMPVTDPASIVPALRQEIEGQGVKVGSPGDAVVVTYRPDSYRAADDPETVDKTIRSRLTPEREALFLGAIRDSLDRYPGVADSLDEVTFGTSPELGAYDETRAAQTRNVFFTDRPGAMFLRFDPVSVFDSEPIVSLSVSQMVFNDLLPPNERVQQKSEETAAIGIGKGIVAVSEYGVGLHEFGHAIVEVARRRDGSNPFDGVDDRRLGTETRFEFDGWQPFVRHGITPQEVERTSRYATSKPEEAFAEMFTAYELGLLDDEVAGKFEGLLAELLGIESPRSPGVSIDLRDSMIDAVRNEGFFALNKPVPPPLRTSLPGVLARFVSKDQLDALYGNDRHANVGLELDRDDISDAEIDALTEDVYEKTQASLEHRGLPEEFVAWRAGPLTPATSAGRFDGGADNFSLIPLDENSYIGGANQSLFQTPYIIRREDVLADVGAFEEVQSGFSSSDDYEYEIKVRAGSVIPLFPDPPRSPGTIGFRSPGKKTKLDPEELSRFEAAYTSAANDYPDVSYIAEVIPATGLGWDGEVEAQAKLSLSGWTKGGLQALVVHDPDGDHNILVLNDNLPTLTSAPDGWFADNTPEGVANHEFAHALIKQRRLLPGIPADFTKWWGEGWSVESWDKRGWDRFRDAGITPQEIQAVSDYAATQPEEAFAEMFAAHRAGLLPEDVDAKFQTLLLPPPPRSPGTVTPQWERVPNDSDESQTRPFDPEFAKALTFSIVPLATFEKTPETQTRGTIYARHPDYDKTIGSVSFTYHSGDRGDFVEVGMLAVEPEHRRQGVATRLNDELNDAFPDTPIDHGPRTEAGIRWAEKVMGGATWTLNGEPLPEDWPTGALADFVNDSYAADFDLMDLDLPDPPRSPGTVATRLEQPVTDPEPVIAEAREALEAAGIKVGNPSDEVTVNVITTISDPLEGTEVTREDNVPVASRLTAKNEALFLAGVQDTVARYPQLSEVLKEVTFTTSLTLGSEDGTEVPDTKPDGSDWTGWRRRISRRAQGLRRFAWGTAPVAFYHQWHEDTDDRPFENRIVGKIVLNDLRPTWGEDSAEWFKPLGSDKITANAYGTAVHEVGHAIHSLAERREGKSPFDDGDDSSWQVFRDHDITPDEIGTISDYAVTKPEETFAEMFTAYEADLLDPELAAKFEGLLAEFLGVEPPRSPGTLPITNLTVDGEEQQVGYFEVYDLPTTTRVFAAFAQGVRPNDEREWALPFAPVAFLTVDTDKNTLELAYTDERFRRQGLIDSLLEVARRDTGASLDTDTGERSPMGREWAAAAGIGTSPEGGELGRDLTQEEADKLGERMLRDIGDRAVGAIVASRWPFGIGEPVPLDEMIREIDPEELPDPPRSPGVVTAENHFEVIDAERAKLLDIKAKAEAEGNSAFPRSALGHPTPEDAEKVAQLVEDAQLVVRLDSPGLTGFLKDGALQTSIDRNERPKWRKSKWADTDSQVKAAADGYDSYLDDRIEQEKKLFGGHPVYGYFRNRVNGPVELDVGQYGSAAIEFEDSVKDRTTYTIGDSIDDGDLVAPMPVGEASVYTGVLGGRIDALRAGEIDTVDDLFKINSWDDKPAARYPEAQIFGDRPKVSEVKRIVFSEDSDNYGQRMARNFFEPIDKYGPNKTQRNLLKKLGIPWVLVDGSGQIVDASETPQPENSPDVFERFDLGSVVHRAGRSAAYVAPGEWIEKEFDERELFVDENHPAPKVGERVATGELGTGRGRVTRIEQVGDEERYYFIDEKTGDEDYVFAPLPDPPRSPGTVVEYGTVFEANDIKVGRSSASNSYFNFPVPKPLLQETARLIEKYAIGGEFLAEITPVSSKTLGRSPYEGGPDSPRVAEDLRREARDEKQESAGLLGILFEMPTWAAATASSYEWDGERPDPDTSRRVKLVINDRFPKHNVEKSLRQSFEQGYSIASDFESVATHEFAHVLASSTLNMIGGDTWSDVFSRDGWDLLATYGIEPFDIEQISEYATTQPEEAFAEMFTAYELGLLDDEPVKEKFEALLADMTGQSVQEAINWREYLHPRDRFGRWRDKPTTLGVTPFRGAGAAQGEDYYETTRYKGFENDIRRYSKEEGVEVEGIERVRGVWQGGGEPSAAVTLVGSDEKVRRVMDRLGSKYNQDGVISFKENTKGDSYRFTSKAKVNRKDLEEALLDEEFNEIAGATILPDGTVEIINIGRDDNVSKQILALSDRLGVDFVYNRGYAQLRFIEQDYPRRTREDARGASAVREGRVEAGADNGDVSGQEGSGSLQEPAEEVVAP